MTFFTECFISAAFFGSSVYMMTVNNDIKDELYNSLPEEAQLHYKKIVKERVSIYIKETIAAIVLAILVNTFYLSKNNSCLINFRWTKRKRTFAFKKYLPTHRTSHKSG